MNVESLHDLFVTELQRVYSVESRLVDELDTLRRDADVDALDDLQRSETREALRDLVERHRDETADHVDRLEAAFDALGRRPESRSTPALDGLLEEKEQFNNVVLNDEIRPLYYAGTGQQIEQLEVDAYERLLRIGSHLDVPDEVVDALERNRGEDADTLEALRDLSDGDDAASLLDELAASP